MLESQIAHYCGPALAGIKSANLAAFYKSDFPDIKDEIKKLNMSLNKKNIFFECVCECEKRILLLVYRKDKLKCRLENPEINNFLKSYGYGNCKSCKDYITHLKKRLKNKDFPHEIGAFLGYPINDIYGFINGKNNKCLMVGEWKVYVDVEGAKLLFERYKACRNGIQKRINQGKTLAQIFCAA